MYNQLSVIYLNRNIWAHNGAFSAAVAFAAFFEFYRVESLLVYDFGYYY